MGEIIEGTYCFWLGLGLYLNEGDYYIFALGDRKVIFIVCGVIIMTARFYAALFQESYYLNLNRKTPRSAQEGKKATAEVERSAYSGQWWHLSFVNLHTGTMQFLLFAFSVAAGAVDVFLLFYTAYYSLRFVVMGGFYTYRAKENLS